MNMIRVIAGVSAAGVFATSAVAQDYSKMADPVVEPTVAVAPVSAPTFDWNGAYAGVGLGYGSMSFDGPADSQSSATGALFGGYRYDTGNYVFGTELVVVPGFGDPTLPGGDEIDSGASLLFSAGMPVTQDRRTLAYLTAGPSMIRTSGAGGSDSAVGATVGLGVDHMITDSMMLRGGLSYTSIDDVGSTNLETGTTNASVGIGFKF
ncbi:outer membrane protein [Roseicitreum antarcticum]|uniref:Opacity protein n=1 Tax=Roseicitreum antarcticum TaxID=564137 RepID=A0A1H2YLR0_9RHOB|nr:outer membrane beta-barrel protein [Roseicitreum antarcticum]SDX06020.1 Opacity protein [Roseicitreum antarcticum]